jgi:DNA-binding CsgD family transcriptional regulator
VQALTERGEHGEAWEILAESGLAGPPQTLSDVYTTNPLLLARAKLKLAGGDAPGALTDLEELRVRQEAFAEHNPALSEWRSTTALALSALGDGDGAGPLVDEEIELARRWGAPRAIGIALRAAGRLATGDEAEGRLREAVNVLAGSFARLEHAHALADLGDRLIENDKPEDAREPLRDALELAHTCGATPLETRIVGLLRAAGARPRRAVQHGPDALTPSERRVAELASSGQSNRQIAEGLFVTVSTVEYHLSNVYRKLGIATRAELESALASAAAKQPDASPTR